MNFYPVYLHIDHTLGFDGFDIPDGNAMMTAGKIILFQLHLGAIPYDGQMVIHRTRRGYKKYYVPFAEFAILEQNLFCQDLHQKMFPKHLMNLLFGFWKPKMYVPSVDITIERKGHQEPRRYMLAADILKVDKLEPGETYPVIECHYVPSDDE